MTWGSNPGGWYTCSNCRQRVFDGKDGDIEAHNAACPSALRRLGFWGSLWRYLWRQA